MGNGAGTVPGADPGLPVGGRDDTPGGRQHKIDFSKFFQKIKEIEKILGRGGWGTPGFSNLLFGKNCIKMKPFDPDNTSLYFCTRL